MRISSFLGVVSVFLVVHETTAFKPQDFKTCSQSGFCRRGRALSARAKEANASWKSPYAVEPSTVSINGGQAVFKAGVKSSLYPDINFGLEVRIQEDGVIRARMDEVGGLRKRYDEAASWALVSEPKISQDIQWKVGKRDARAAYGPKKTVEVVVSYDPLQIALFRDGKEQVVVNGKGLLHMEHFRNKPEPPAAVEGSGDAQPTDDSQVILEQPVNPREWFEGKEDDWWEEKFGSWTDTKPKGPESLSIDINFPNHGVVYGIPQHATNLALPTTTGEEAHFTDPYRLYNADVFEYLASSPVSLYGSIPLMHAHSKDSTVAVFHVVGSETWIDVSHPSEKSTDTHWISESGILDLFILPGPTPEEVFAQYARLTGTPVLPAQWSLGYHQCRWNYVSSEDIRTVQRRFDEENIPVDVLWLDIEYAEGHKYFMWNDKTFPDPVDMINDVAATGRKMVVIVDPHLKREQNYPVYKKASELEVLVKPASGQGEYEGWCWPGSSSWVDFFNPKSWDWWKSLYKIAALPNGEWSWTQSTEDVHIWNDMNEPSVFNGPEITMPKDNIHHGGWEHRDVHNINGMLYPNLTWQALANRSTPAKRPFVLTRAFFAGSQRYGAMWTGDNMGTWEHMAVGVKMVLANGLAGLSFAGSDVGGFFGNPEPEMLVRWYTVGAFAPFFRAHAHIDTKRREPYLLDDPYKSIVYEILRLRYTMLPMWYTAFRETTVTGVPILRPQYIMFPKDESGFTIDDQYYIGSTGLLFKPVTEKNIQETIVYLAEDQVYYGYFSNMAFRGTANGRTVVVPSALNQIPLLIRGGSIIPTRERRRRSSTLMKRDPFTLRIALSKDNTARGDLYLDDGETWSHEKGQFVWREFNAKKKGKGIVISSSDLGSQKPNEAVEGISLATYNPLNEYAKTVEDVRVEKVIVLGLKSKPKSVKVVGGKELIDWEFTGGEGSASTSDGTASRLIIKDPKVLVVKDWSIEIV